MGSYFSLKGDLSRSAFLDLPLSEQGSATPNVGDEPRTATRSVEVASVRLHRLIRRVRSRDLSITIAIKSLLICAVHVPAATPRLLEKRCCNSCARR